MGVGQDSADEADDGALVGEDAHHAGSAFDLLVDPLDGVVGPDLGPVRPRERGERQDLGLGVVSGPIFGNALASWSRTCSQVACTALASGWAKIVRNSAATMSLWDLGTRASRLRAKWTRQRWCAAPAKHRDRALTSPACWSEITRRTPDRPRSFRSVRNLRQNVSSSLSPTSRPRISRVPCWVTPVATTTRLGHHLPAGGLAHVQVRRVQVHVREGGVAQGIGLALMEEFTPGRGENLHDYLIPTIGDIPPIETFLIEDPSSVGPFGAKGIGEQALIPTAPAIYNAIHQATGVRVHRAPATPDRLRAAILALETPS